MSHDKFQQCQYLSEQTVVLPPCLPGIKGLEQNNLEPQASSTHFNGVIVTTVWDFDSVYTDTLQKLYFSVCFYLNRMFTGVIFL